MSLVAYGSSSDDSEEEISAKKLESVRATKKQKVKIAIPSLKEFEKDENEVPKKKPKFQSGSGLLSLLPPPKNASTLSKPGFVPHILKSKKEQSPSSTMKKSDSASNGPETTCILNPYTPVEHDSDGETCENDKSPKEIATKDFFSLDGSEKQTSSNSLLENSSETSLPTSSGNDKLSFQSQSSELQYSSSLGLQHPSFENEPKESSYSQLQYEQSSLSNEPQIEVDYPQGSSEQADSSGFYTDLATEPDSKEMLLKNERFLRLQGRRHKLEDVDIIEVNGADQLTDKKQWLMKSLTEESTHRPSRKKHDMPTQQQKRKHQITYLAFQAKEREMDLKNQWSLNSRTRRETQAKYGF